ncbi:DUF2207 domain-containing protein [Eubacterium sp. 1001713B170207_170306_E7]|uniref:DUF2207 domain-containing protein n=1 Tax=Eubacterium sp. 1001713B170207_170306_E7 TaxID=2787097 RepID=UPI00189AD6CC|nr:DUF2207 domain-containing protein [Eubacterium sp. 1001713B170207_170306_E7]
MKKKLPVLAALILLLALVFPGTGLAREYFTIDSYDVTMNVQENHAYDVNEKINVTFSQPRHGIYRYIPYSGSFYRDIDGKATETSYNARVSNIRVSGSDFETDSENGSKVIQIGDADRYVDGNQTYNISYTWDPGDDHIDQFDDVYFNIIPQNWDTTIESATFTINMPKEFDASKVEFITGSYGGTVTDAVSFTVDGNTIHGTLNQPLQPNEGVTLNIRLPQGYFVGMRTGNEWLPAVYIVSGLCLILAIILWFRYGRDQKPLEPVMFYAPDKLTPAQVGTIIDGKTGNEEILSMIMYLADKGYLTIEQTSKKNFKFEKVQELPANALSFEHTVMRALFPNGRTVSSMKDLEDTFYEDMQVAKAEVSGFFAEPQNKLFTSGSKAAQGFIHLACFLPLFIFGCAVGYKSEGFFDVFIVLIMGCLFGVLPFAGLTFLSHTLETRRGMTAGSFTGKMAAGALISAVLLIIVLAAGTATFGSILPPLAAVIAAVVAGFLSAFATKRTPQGNKWLGETLGFKNFIQTAELDRIKTLVDENPNYFFDVLPYAYVLGVTDKWAKRFESLAIEPPYWYRTYDSYSMFNTIYFTNALMHSMNAISTNITVPPNSGSGGFGGGGFTGGGGFSGGGGGGGGGGSW